jgi:hypothetical protein
MYRKVCGSASVYFSIPSAKKFFKIFRGNYGNYGNYGNGETVYIYIYNYIIYKEIKGLQTSAPNAGAGSQSSQFTLCVTGILPRSTTKSYRKVYILSKSIHL